LRRVRSPFSPAENFSPHGADATLRSRLGVTEELTGLDANGSAVPALAESWKRESDRSWLFTLREATFQDGADVTPSAVAAALTRAAGAKPVPAALSGVAITAKAVGGQQVSGQHRRPRPRSRDAAAAVSSGLAVLSAKTYEKKDTASPVGTATGPFEFTRTTGTTTATLDRFDEYWGSRAQASDVDAKFISDGAARTNALRTGDVDIAEAVPVSQAASLDKGTRRETATTRTTSLLLNTTPLPST
jgi:peptide/nickel transport system substrate-binding protein